MWRASAFSDYQRIRRIIRGQIQYRRETGRRGKEPEKNKKTTEVDNLQIPILIQIQILKIRHKKRPSRLAGPFKYINLFVDASNKLNLKFLI